MKKIKPHNRKTSDIFLDWEDDVYLNGLGIQEAFQTLFLKQEEIISKLNEIIETNEKH